MSRPPRFTYAHAVHHVTLRCNNREFLFTVPTHELFHGILQEARQKFPLELYNYCLMTNHVHLVFQVGRADTLSRVMHWISTSFSRRFNKLSGRHGHLWDGRFRSTIIEQDTCFLRSMAYLDLNPVRARMVATPLEYRWSGHRALRDENTADIDLHPLYLGSAPNRRSRYRSYMKMLAEEASRPAFSLATTYFAGTSDFIWRMQRRFGLDRPGASVEETELGSGVVRLCPRVGGVCQPKSKRAS